MSIEHFGPYSHEGGVRCAPSSAGLGLADRVGGDVRHLRARFAAALIAAGWTPGRRGDRPGRPSRRSCSPSRPCCSCAGAGHCCGRTGRSVLAFGGFAVGVAPAVSTSPPSSTCRSAWRSCWSTPVSCSWWAGCGCGTASARPADRRRRRRGDRRAGAGARPHRRPARRHRRACCGGWPPRSGLASLLRDLRATGEPSARDRCRRSSPRGPDLVLGGGRAAVRSAWSGVLPMRASTADVELAGTQVSWLVPIAGAVAWSPRRSPTPPGSARRVGSAPGSPRSSDSPRCCSRCCSPGCCSTSGPRPCRRSAGWWCSPGSRWSEPPSGNRTSPRARSWSRPAARLMDILATTCRRAGGSVGRARLPRWLAGFAERHGAVDHHHADSEVSCSPAPTARRPDRRPFPPLTANSSSTSHAIRRVGVLLVRRGGYAVGVFDGERLHRLESRFSSYVQGTTKAGGWSQQRYARRRAEPGRCGVRRRRRRRGPGAGHRAARSAGRRRGPGRGAGRARRPAADRAARASPPWLQVKDPKLRVLAATPDQFRAVRIRLVP